MLPAPLKNTALCKVRTVTTFITLPNDQNLWASIIEKASRVCYQLVSALAEKNYETQSIRIVTNPFGEYLDTNSIDKASEGLQAITNLLSASKQSGYPYSLCHW